MTAQALDLLAAQLDREHERADKAEQRADADHERAEAERARADRAERRLEVLQATLDAKSRDLAAMTLAEQTSPPVSTLLGQMADKDVVIDDLRQRLDEKRTQLTRAQVEAAEVRGRLAAMEADQRTAPAVLARRSWLPWRRR